MYFSGPPVAPHKAFLGASALRAPRWRGRDLGRHGVRAATVALLALAVAISAATAGATATSRSANFTGRALEPIALNVTVDPGWPVESWWWDFEGDGAFDQGAASPNVTHSYPLDGTFDAVLEARHANGTRANWTFVVLVAPANVPPEVAIARPPDGFVVTDRLTVVALTAVVVDADGTVALHEWDFDGDGTFDWSSATTPGTTHLYGRLGNFTSVLRATDDAGGHGEDHLRVEVRDIAPVLRPPANVTSDTGLVELSVSASDPDGEVVRYEWDFGDGSPVLATVEPDATHDYGGTGRWRASVLATDDDGGSSSALLWVEVLPPSGRVPPTVLAGADVTVLVGEAVRFEACATAGSAPIVRISWDLDGDGTDDVLGAVQEHSYGAPGVVIARATARDANGLCATATRRVEVLPVANAPPVPVPSVEQWARPGDGLEFGDLSHDDDGRIVLWQWDFDGDGRFDFASNASGSTTHHYAEEGVYAAVLRVTDDRGEVNSTSVTVRVSWDAPGGDGDDEDAKGAVVCCASMLVAIVLVVYFTMRRSLASPRKDRQRPPRTGAPPPGD